MSLQKANRIRLIYGIITSLLIAICAVLLIIHCIGIYESGERPFNRENVSLALQRISIPGWLCLTAVLGGFVLQFVLPNEQAKRISLRSQRQQLSRYRSKFTELTAEERKLVTKEIRFRKIFLAIGAIACAAVLLIPAVSLLQPGYFTVDSLGADVPKTVIQTVIFGFVFLFELYFMLTCCDQSMGRELQIYKNSAVKPEKIAVKEDNTKNLSWIRMIVLAGAVMLIVLGILNGSHKDVLDKAIKICTECIGLG